MANYTRQQLEQFAGLAANKYGLPLNLFKALIGRESGWDPTVVSSAGAIGLGQLMPGTAQGLDVDPNNPRQNLFGAAKYLSDQYKKFGDWKLALAAYNAGPGAVTKYGGIPPYAETQAYVQNILGDIGGLKAIQDVIAGQQPQVPGTGPLTTSQPGAAAPDATRLAALQSVARIASGEKVDPVKNLSELIATRQAAQAAAPTVAPGMPGTPTSSAPLTAGDPVTLPNGIVQPIAGKVPTRSAFGYVDAEGMPDAKGVKHHGAVDWFGKAGTAVRSPWAGEVVEVKASRGNSGQVFGGVVKIRDPRTGYVFVARHIDPSKFKVGQDVDAGTVLGGITAWRDGSPHAHIEIWKTLEGGYRYENAIDPITVFGAD